MTEERVAKAEENQHDIADRDWSLLEATQESLREHMAEIKRLRALLKRQPATWAGLTDAELSDAIKKVDRYEQYIPSALRHLARVIEEKLKEKNT